jgi:hypothetical protein
MLPLQQHHLEFCFLAGFVRIRGRSAQPPFNLLKRYRVFGAGLADFDVEDRRRPDFFEPRVFAKQLDRDDRSLVQALGLDLRGVPDLPVVYIADEAQANGHGRREYHDFRFLFSPTGCVETTAYGNGTRKMLKSVGSPLTR